MDEEDAKKKKPFNSPFSESIFFRNNKTATIEEVIIKLILEKDKKFCNTFLKTFYSIEKFSPIKFLELLLDLYETPNITLDISENSTITPFLIVSNFEDLQSETTTIRLNIINFIKDWISYIYAFDQNLDLIKKLENFIQIQLETPNFVDVKLCNILKDKLISLRSNQSSRVRSASLAAFSNNSNNNNNNNNNNSSSVNILQFANIFTATFLTSKFSAEVLAQQITHFEYNLMNKVHLREFLDPTIPENELQRYLTYSNKIKSMIILEIIREENRMQIQLFQKAVKIAEKCIEYNNYSTPLIILSALFSQTLVETERSKIWEGLSIKTYESLERLCSLLSPDENYAKYKSTIAQKQVFIPCLRVHIVDIWTICKFNKASIFSSIINIEQLNLLQNEFALFSHTLNGIQLPFPIDEDYQNKFLNYLKQFPEYLTPGNKKLSSPYISEKPTDEGKYKYAVDQFKNFFSDSFLGNRENPDFTSENIMRQRDWIILTANGTSLSYAKSESIFTESDELDTTRVYILLDGKVTLSSNGAKLISIKGPAVLAESTLVDASVAFQTVCDKSPSTVVVVKKEFLFSLLESDPLLSLRFFNSLTIQVIEQLKNSNFRSSVSNKQINANGKQNAIPFRVISRRLSHISTFDPNLAKDKEVRDLFSWSSDEVVIKKYEATLGGKLSAQGSLYITQNHVCFYSKMLINVSKIVIPLAKIDFIKKENQRITVVTSASHKKSAKGTTFRFKDGMEDEATTIINGLIAAHEYSREQTSPRLQEVEHQINSLDSRHRELTQTQKMDIIQLKEEDWNLLLRYSKQITLTRNEVLIHQSENPFKLFRVISGTCRIESIVDEKPFVLSACGPSEFVGEISMIQNKGASASVLVDSERAQFIVIEPQYLQRLFQVRPELASKFMYYIFCIVLRRVCHRFWYETQNERKVADIITEPLYNSICPLGVSPSPNNRVIHAVYGPTDREISEIVNSKISSKNYVCAQSISTYPKRKPKNVNEEPIRDGDPICDQYKAIFYHNRIIVAIADGCNWGEGPRSAALSATNAFTSYLQNHFFRCNNIKYYSALIQRAFSIANHAIFLDRSRISGTLGTTTLLGGIVTQLDTLQNVSKSSWGFVYGSIGDCKAFHWSNTTGKFSDLTQYNRNQSQNATDPGGRLGPHINGIDPDLRNFELGFFPCFEGDYFILVSDGVHDNLDPSLLGFSPSHLGLAEESWEMITDTVYLEEVKTDFRLRSLERIIFHDYNQYDLSSLLSRDDLPDFRKLPPPDRVVENLTEFAKIVCSPAATWMQENPSRRLPKDYKLYPGKMDHTTVLCFIVGHPIGDIAAEKKGKKKEKKFSLDVDL